jgi:hypothetical protein
MTIQTEELIENNQSSFENNLPNLSEFAKIRAKSGGFRAFSFTIELNPLIAG